MVLPQSKYDRIFDHCLDLIESSNKAMERGRFGLSVALFTNATTTLKLIHHMEKIRRLGGRML